MAVDETIEMLNELSRPEPDWRHYLKAAPKALEGEKMRERLVSVCDSVKSVKNSVVLDSLLTIFMQQMQFYPGIFSIFSIFSIFYIFLFFFNETKNFFFKF